MSELRRLATDYLPLDPEERSALAAELRRRAADVKEAATAPRQEVVVADIHMSFGSMVIFMVKLVLASMPALIILSVIGWVIFMVSAAMLAALAGLGHR